jgi:manganese efflux pump family protein
VIRLKIITIFLIAVSLSMDAFSLALIYGTQGIAKKDKLLLSLIVGVYHFIMPLIGVIIGNLITSKILINTNILVGIILSLIAVEMIISSFKETNNKFLLTFPSYLIFGLSVSIDSLTTGIGLSFSFCGVSTFKFSSGVSKLFIFIKSIFLV